MKAETWMGSAGRKATERAQPNAAPAERPRMKGSTKGFLKTPWRVAPAPESAAPTMAARMILGSLMSRMIESAGVSPG